MIKRIAVAFEAGRDGFWAGTCAGSGLATSRSMSFMHIERRLQP